MKRPRRLLLILLLFVGGAIVNVAVAWGCVQFAALYPSSTRLSTIGDIPMLARSGWTPPSQAGGGVATWTFDGCGVQWRWHQQQQNANAQLENVATDVSAGWPYHSLAGMMIFDPSAIAGGSTNRQWRQFWLLTTEDFPQRGAWWGFPLCPLWPGFAINTVFYAGVLWLLFAAPFALRRRRRIKRGLCPKCAYDLRGSAGTTPCPECGATAVAS